ncbi:MAG: PepSY domain-containing protein [Planctomycetes bacterium]|nr:PepSY domain-containing protein [Planctomycetota bacterium]
MRLASRIRRWHHWTTPFVALPLLVIVTSGLLLQLKKHWEWVQPAERTASATAPVAGFPELLAALAARPELAVDDWTDVRRLDVRPGRGLAKAWLVNGLEVQLDLADGSILHVAPRRSDLIESLHDGSWFAGDWSKLLLFLPTGAALLFLWASGVWMFCQPFLQRWRRRRGAGD